MVMQKFPLAIVGCELLTPLDGPGAETTWQAIRAGRRVEKQTAICDQWLEGDVDWDRSIRLALAVARRAVGERKLNHATDLFCGTSKGPVGTFLAALDRVRRGELPTDMQARHVALGVGAMGPMLAERLAIGGRVHTSVAACSSGVHALHRAACALWRGECERAVVVAADASLHALFEGSFARLGVLSPFNASGFRTCEPFGEGGEGFFLIEAAAALVLERGDVRGADSPLAWLEDSWIGADASALVAIDPQTESLRAGLHALNPPGPLGFVHAHATGTGHDAFEAAAIHAAIGCDAPCFSCKGFLGHSLGAAGLVSVALSIRCHQHGETLLGTPIAAQSRSLTIAQGFGGHIGLIRLRGS